MSFKENQKNPDRKASLAERRVRQLSAVTSPERPRWVNPKGRPAYVAPPRVPRYILAGSGTTANPLCNLKAHQIALVVWG